MNHLTSKLLKWTVLHWPSRHFKGRMLQQWLLPNAPQSGEFQATLENGEQFQLRHSEAIGKVVSVLGTYEPGELAYLRSTLRIGQTVIDVGANIGVFSIVMSKLVGPSGRVLSVEPHPNNLKRLKEHIALNKLENMVIYPVAAADKPGELNLHFGNDEAYASVENSQGQYLAVNVNSLQVPVRTLDDIWRDASSPDVSFIKIDVEGAELSVLQGAQELLKKCKPVLLMEANDESHRQTLFSAVEPLGYVCKAPRSFAKYNYLFVPCS